jgi:hypothetical protein
MKKLDIKRLLKPENGIEEAIVAHPDFVEGCNYGKPRSGHPEGKVLYHIIEVLNNIDEFYGDDPDRQDLRVMALVHDTFKHKVDQTKPKVGANHHGAIARTFTQKFITDYKVLQIIEKHDEAYNAWSQGGRKGNWYKAEERANKLIQGLLLEGGLGLYIKFYKCDNRTGDKEQDNYDWFIGLIK